MTTELNPNAAEPAKRKPSKRKRALFILVAVVIAAGIGWGLWYFLVGRWHEGTDDAYVQGNVVSITSQVAGTVVSIGADDGMKVQAGQVLVQLDPNDASVAYGQAVANLANTVRQVRGLYSTVESGRADIAAEQVNVQKARADVQRRSGLVATGAVSAEELAHAREALSAAEAALSSSRGELSRSSALVDSTTLSDQPQVQAAAGQLRLAYLNLQRAAIIAPVSGYVAKRSVQLGQRVQPGTPLMTVIPLEQVWVDANFKETQLGRMRLGQPVELTSDLYGSDVTYKGRLVSLGLGTGAAFSLLPAQNASGNWIKIVQRVPVRIELDPKQLAEHPLRLGMSMSTDVTIRDQSGPVLPAAVPAKPVLSTQVFAQQLRDADAVIARIIRDNLPNPRHG
ncbi:efflux RND transporter periplasmic adaptor subunit [Cognatiluteimonas profundi]|uniref:HlyD family secretion protein n=1 Tax=Cognatiluteimonas profundi TaxID=2594501 RepID=UPI00131E13AA|nr:HlyD family efflux transporter periplasmic adaptor subunit [Lysobacter profundi]